MSTLTNKKISEILKLGEKGSNTLLNRYSREIVKAYKEALADVQKEIADMFEKYGEEVKYSDMAKFNRLTNIEKRIAERLNKLNGTVTKTTASAIKDQYQYWFYRSGFALETSTLVRLGFGILPEIAVKAALLNPLLKVNWNGRQKRHIQELIRTTDTVISQGLLRGHGYAKIARNLRKRSDICKRKSLGIIQTETHRVSELGKHDAFNRASKSAKKLGFEIEKVWVATIDKKTRDDHVKMDGDVADKDGLFHFPNGGETTAPGNSGIAEEDIGCRCTTVAQVKGFEPSIRKNNITKEMMSYKTINEWMADRIMK